MSVPRAGAWNSCRVTAVGVTSGRRYWAAILQPTRSTGVIRVPRCAQRRRPELLLEERLTWIVANYLPPDEASSRSVAAAGPAGRG